MWGKCEKPKSGKNVKNSLEKVLEKNVEKIGVEKRWTNDLEEVKSVGKCRSEKKRENFPWKNISYLVVCTRACVPFLRLDIKFHRETELASIASAEDECKRLLLHHC